MQLVILFLQVVLVVDCLEQQTEEQVGQNEKEQHPPPAEDVELEDLKDIRGREAVREWFHDRESSQDGSQEKEEEVDANSSLSTDASSDGEDDVDAEALNFQKILATARRRGGDKAADQSVISITSGGGGVDESPAAANTPTQGDGQANLIQKLLDEVQSLRTEHANLRQRASIAEVFSKTSTK